MPNATLEHSVPKALGPRAYPIVGHLPSFLHDRLGFLMRCAEAHGDVARLLLGGDTFLLNNPGDIWHVLVVHGDNYVKTPRLTSAKGKELSGAGLLTSVGAAHLRQRRMMQPAFSRRTIETFAATIAEESRNAIARWRPESILDIGREMTLIAQRNIVKIACGIEADADLLAAIATRRRYMARVFFWPLPQWVPTPLDLAYRRAMKHIDNLVFQAIRARRQQPVNRDDLLSMLLQARYDDGTGMSDEEIRDEIVMLLVTGSETNADMLTWTCYLLARHPAVEDAVRREVDDVLGGRVPTAADCSGLTYTNMVLSESMRLYPPTWIFVRIAVGSDRLPSGAVIPVGAKLYLSQYVMHRNGCYFPDPERFDPERFSEAGRKALSQGAYFPFGAGVRLCIGEHLARLESASVLASVVQNVRLSLATDEPVIPHPRMTLTPKHAIRMRVIEHRSVGASV